MLIGGLEKLSLIDFPGHISAVVFLKFCNFRCHYCYNPMLVLAVKEDEIDYNDKDPSLFSEKDFFLFLKDRIGKLDGVVISGGEPTLQKGLKEFIIKIKDLGFDVKLDTNGTKPELINDLIENKLIDYIAMDFKAPFAKYEDVVGVKVDLKDIKKTIDIMKRGKIPYEFRTTLVPGLHKPEEVIKMAEELGNVKNWFIQKFKSDTDLVNNDFKNKRAFSDRELRKLLEEIKKIIPNSQLRE